MQVYIDDSLEPLSNYIEKYYIGKIEKARRKRPRFPPRMWSVFDRFQQENDPDSQDLPRTNNSVDAWHNAFQRTIGYQHPNVFKLIEAFRKEQSRWEIDLARIRGGNLPKEGRRKYRALNHRLKTVVGKYNEYIARDINHINYLKAIATNLDY